MNLRKLTASIGLAASLFVLAACNPGLVAVTVDPLTTPPTTTEVSSDKITIAEGTGVGLKVYAYTQDPEERDQNGNPPDPLGTRGVNVFSEEDAVATVRHVDGATYVLVAVKAGHTNILVNSIDADGYIKIPVLVTAQ